MSHRAVVVGQIASAVGAIALAACGDNQGDPSLAYAWDGDRLVCSYELDDYKRPEDWERVDAQLGLAYSRGWVAIFHTHVPGVTISRGALDRVLTAAASNGLEFLTFRDLGASRQRAGIALAFDDSAVDQWVTMRETLAAHHARVTFFVTQWQYMTPMQHQELAELAGDGHDLEAHSVNHVNGPDYVAQDGMAAYIANEVLPSIQVIADAGFPRPTTYAYPFGARTAAMDDAILQYVDRVRGVGPCPRD